jgi:hypothetical protein
VATEAFLLSVAYSEEELEKALKATLGEMMGGKAVVQWAVGESSATKQLWMNYPPKERALIIGEALNLKNPDKYPSDSIQKITQTRPIFVPAIPLITESTTTTTVTDMQQVYTGASPPAAPDDPTLPALFYPTGGGTVLQWDVASQAWV